MTVDEPRVRVTTNLAFGICLILLGTALMLERLQIIEAAQILRFWPVALVLFGAALVFQSFQRPDATAGAATRSAFDGGQAFVWIVVAIVMSQVFSARETTTLSDSNATVNVVAVMGRQNRVVNATAFRGGEMTAVMGRSDLDLRNANATPGGDVVVEVFVLMGGGTIRVPEGWTIETRTTPIMGGVKDRRSGARDVAGAPRLVLRGLVMIGGISIRS